MPQQERISRWLRFIGQADKGDNIYGNPSFNKVRFEDDFLGDIIDDAYAVNIDNSSTGAIVAGIGGTLVLTTEAKDNDKVEVAHELNWEAAKSCIFETRLYTDDVTNACICAGFNDAKNETAQTMAFSVSNVTITNTTSDAVMFVMDADQAVDNWYAMNDKNNAAAGSLTDVAPANSVYQTLRIALDTTGKATYSIDGKVVYVKAAAITNTDDLTPYIGFQNRATDISTLVVDYVKCWQDRA